MFIKIKKKIKNVSCKGVYNYNWNILCVKPYTVILLYMPDQHRILYIVKLK